MRVGQGYDVHPFRQGRRLVLGGVSLEGEIGLAGHSDGDVLTHAVIDALLGAAALGDIGGHFPTSDERWRDAESIEMLKQVVKLIAQAGFRAVNVDVTVIAERPRIAPHVVALRQNLAMALGVESARVSVKATTTDGLGAVGRGEGIAAMAVVLLEEMASAPKPPILGGQERELRDDWLPATLPAPFAGAGHRRTPLRPS